MDIEEVLKGCSFYTSIKGYSVELGWDDETQEWVLDQTIYPLYELGRYKDFGQALAAYYEVEQNIYSEEEED